MEKLRYLSDWWLQCELNTQVAALRGELKKQNEENGKRSNITNKITKYYWSKHLKTKMLCSFRFDLVEQQQKNDFKHSSQEIQLRNETLQKHNYLIEEHWSGHNQLDESHKMLRGEISNLKLSYYWTFSHPKRLFIHHLNTTLSFLPTGHFEELKSHFESFTTDANTKFQRQADVNSELETKIEKAKSEQEVNHNESLSKIEMA